VFDIKAHKIFQLKDFCERWHKGVCFSFHWLLYSVRPLCCLNVQLLSAGHAELVSWTPYQLAMSRLPHGLVLSGAHALSVTWCLAIKTSFYFLFSDAQLGPYPPPFLKISACWLGQLTQQGHSFQRRKLVATLLFVLWSCYGSNMPVFHSAAIAKCDFFA